MNYINGHTIMNIGINIMSFTHQRSLRFFGIVILSIILSACGGGGNDEPVSGQPIAPIFDPTPAPGPGPVPAPAPPAELASRVQGVAPLAVFFDTINVAGIAQPPEVNGRREYADFDYTWNFNDPSSGTWATSGHSKNEASGYVAAHVFETPGTYTVTLSVKDGVGVDELHQVTITVEDPDTVYAGGSTICVSSTSVFTGCPSGAVQLTTTVVNDVATYIATGRRILFRRGESWTTTAALALSGADTITIGAYGTCTSPDARGICSNAPVLNLTGGSQSGLFNLDNLSDGRIMDLNFVDVDRGGFAGGSTGLDRILHLRLQSEGGDTAFGAFHYNTGGHDQIAYVDNDFVRSDQNVIFVGSERLIILGNRLRDPGDSHVLRVWQAYKGVISHNELSGSSALSGSGRHALKLHGPSETVIADTGSGGLDNRTQYVVIADNLLGASGPWPMAVGPQDSGADELVQDVVIENNDFYPGWGTQSCCSNGIQSALKVWASYTTVRNNILSGEGSSKYYTGITIERRGIEPTPTGNRVFNNTIYKSDYAGSGSQYVGIKIGVNALNTTIQNNLIHLNQTAPVTMISDSGTNTIESNNLLTSSPGLVDPDNSNFMAKDFSLELSSAAVNAGTNVPVFKDNVGGERTLGGATDLGAFERQ